MAAILRVLRCLTVLLVGGAGLSDGRCLAAEVNPCHLLLPKVVHAVVGREINIYFDNIVLAPPGRLCLFDVACAKGKQLRERWTFTPADSDVGDLPLSVEVCDLNDKPLASASTMIRVVPANAGAGKPIRLLAIGDSLTHASLYTDELLKLCAGAGNPGLKLLGTHKVEGTVEGNVHEGYGGWKYSDFTEKYEPNPEPASYVKRSSPFVFKGTSGPVFDFSRYIKESCGGIPPDLITIYLGANDIAGATDANREETIQQMMGAAEKLLVGLRSGAPKALIGLVTPCPTSTQDGFGENYGCSIKHWTYRKSQYRGLEELIAKYSGRESARIFIIPAYVNFDGVHNYPIKTDAPANARVTAPVPRDMNALHPALSGYQQLADSIYAWMKCVLN